MARADVAEGLGRAEELGFNAVSFRVLDFRPVDGRFEPGTEPRAALTGWENGNAVDAAQVKAFMRPADGSLDIVNRAGHDVRFTGRRVCPVQFILRHYPIRSPEHGMRKVLKERLPRFAAEERKAGWHVQYDQLVAEGAKFVWEPLRARGAEPGRGARGAALPTRSTSCCWRRPCAATTSAGWRSTTRS